MANKVIKYIASQLQNIYHTPTGIFLSASNIEISCDKFPVNEFEDECRKIINTRTKRPTFFYERIITGSARANPAFKYNGDFRLGRETFYPKDVSQTELFPDDLSGSATEQLNMRYFSLLLINCAIAFVATFFGFMTIPCIQSYLCLVFCDPEKIPIGGHIGLLMLIGLITFFMRYSFPLLNFSALLYVFPLFHQNFERHIRANIDEHYIKLQFESATPVVRYPAILSFQKTVQKTLPDHVLRIIFDFARPTNVLDLIQPGLPIDSIYTNLNDSILNPLSLRGILRPIIMDDEDSEYVSFVQISSSEFISKPDKGYQR